MCVPNDSSQGKIADDKAKGRFVVKVPQCAEVGLSWKEVGGEKVFGSGKLV